MKRSILALSLILILVLSLASCFGESVEQEYKALNELAANLPNPTTVSTRVTSPDSLIAEEGYYYRFTGNYYQHQSYTLNGFTPNGDGYDIPDKYFEIVESTISVEEFEALRLLPEFNFSSTALANGKVMGNSLTADITDAKAFFGKDLDGTDIKLTVYYNQTAINSIAINYTSENGNTVLITYMFQ